MKFYSLCIALTVFSVLGVDGKQPLTEAAYKDWRYVKSEIISADGQKIAYEQKDRNSLQRLFLHVGNKVDTINGGTMASFSPDGKFFLYSVKAKTKAPYYVRNIETGHTRSFVNANVVTFLNDQGSVVKVVRNSTDTSAAMRKSGTTDIVFHYANTGDSLVLKNVKSHRMSAKNDLMFVSQKTADGNKLSVCDLRTKDQRPIKESATIEYTLAAFDQHLTKVAFIKKDTASKSQSICVYTLPGLKLIASIDDKKIAVPSNFTISDKMKLDFSQDGNRIFFKIEEKAAPVQKKNPVNVEIWKWDSDYIAPSKSNLAVGKKSHFCQYDLKGNRFVMLSGDDMPYLQFPQGDAEDLTIGFSDLRYRKDEGVEPSIRYDSYLVDMKTGDRKLILEKKYYNPTISHDKKYVAWFNVADSSWYSMDNKTLTKRNLTKQIADIFYNDALDLPMHATHHGSIGWTNNGHNILIHSKNDLWMIDASGKNNPVCLTKNEGRKNGITFRFIKVSESDRYFDLSQRNYFSAFEDKTKKSGYYALEPNGAFRKLIFDDWDFSELKFSKDGSKCIWRKQRFDTYPEIHYSDSNFENVNQLTQTNPQQKEYNWGTSELVEWESFNKDSLQGILCKPENFDPTKKYPMIVYFYEKRSDNLHRYNTPTPIGTVVNWSYCVSNGYIVFIPDVVFRAGDPGASSYDAVVSGVKTLIDKYDFIDKDRIGINGHSWGGYQVAYLVTRTNMFRAAVSGAPVVNMVSGYGGIRWGSGKSRMFQYEQSQSRIGGTLWDKPMEYIRNSPIFYIPAINTPLLIMHNDKDGSVMWEQGIEFFMALRRLNKPSWMLNYKNEDHKLENWNNRLDYSRKVMGFYDYYLKDAPKPDWM